MSFDMEFYRFIGSENKMEQMNRLRDDPPNADEVDEIKRIVSVLVEYFPGAAWGTHPKGIEYGAFIERDDIPEIHVSRRQVFISYHPDPDDPESLKFLRDLMKLLESQGYEAFDLQRGEFVSGDTYEW